MEPSPTDSSSFRQALQSCYAPLVLLIACLPVGCDREVQAVRIAVQDNRFVPDQIALTSDSPISLTLVNEGHEVHEFTSPLFTIATTRILAIDPRYGDNVVADLQTRNIHPDLIPVIVEGLRKAGLAVNGRSADNRDSPI